MSGWPTRAPRSAFGEEYVDLTPVRDPRKQIGAATLNLDFWQVAGMSRTAPRAILHFQGAASPTILNRGEVWNPNAGDTGSFADPSFVSVATGNYLIEFPTPQLDELGNSIGISFLFGVAVPTDEDSTADQRCKASIISATRNQVRVTARDSAGALAHMAVAVLLW